MKKLKMRAIAALLCLTLIAAGAGTADIAFASKSDNAAANSRTTGDDSRIPSYNTSISYGEYKEQHASAPSASDAIVLKGSDYSETDMDVTTEGDNVVTGTEGSISWEVDVPKDAMYEIEIEYGTLANKGNEIQMSLFINDEIPFAQASTIVFRRMYMDENKDYKEMKGNQSFPSQVEYDGWQTMSVSDNEGYYTGALQFFFEKGKNTLTLEALKDVLVIKSITLKPVTETISYEDYLAEHKAEGAAVITEAGADRVQGEDATLKSSPSFRPQNDRTSPATEPYDPTYIIMNTIGGSSWSSNGDWMEWEVNVPKTGLYKIAARYKQSDNTGFSSVRSLTINGELPFAEAADIRFPYGTSFQVTNLTSADGTELYFYLEEGVNTIRLTCALGGYSEIVTEVDAVIEELSTIYQSITAITGTAPNSYQDYQLTTRLPNLVKDLRAVAAHLEEVKGDITDLTGSTSDVSASMERCVALLKEIAEKPSKIQNKVTSIADNITALGSSIITLTSQPLTLDWIQLMGENDKLPKAEGSFWAKIKHEFLSFIGSFTNDYSVATDESDQKDEKGITVWISTGRDQMEVIRRLVNESFTLDTGIPVSIKLVDSSIIMTAIAAGNGPDVAIGVSSTLPMELAFRGASYELSSFDDFDEVKSQFMDAAVECYNFDGKYYGIPDQMSFSVMFYRKDILSQYGVAVPETWEDLISIIPTLATYNMEAYLDKDSLLTLGSASSVGASKAVNNVYLSMLYQKGGELYNQDGTESLLDSKESIASFTTWTEFYNKYGFSTTIDFVTRFRLGSVPIAIMDISYYNRLSISAPEINGKWSIALVPGTVQEDGTVDHSVPVTTSAAMIIKDSAIKHDSADESWEFLKWWVSAETQSSYASEMESVLGSSGRYMVANLESFDRVSWSTDVAAVLNDSLQWLREVRQIPGCYLTGLNLDNAFYQVINNSTDEPIDVITEYNETLNEEIAKKRSEFGLDK